jgi:Tol biopolymer transport system component
MGNLESPERHESTPDQPQNLGQAESSEVSPDLSQAEVRGEGSPEVLAEVNSPSRALPQSPISKKLILGLIGIVLVTFTILAAGVCVAYFFIRQAIEATPWSIPLLAEQPSSLNQIAFIGNDENLWVVSPDGSNLRPVTNDGRGYRFPTWAPDSRSLAFIGPGTGATALFVSPAEQSEPKIVYSQPGSPPFYLYWAPDSHSISFLTQEKDGLALRLVDAQMPEGQRIMDEGAPFYWAWAPNSDRLVMHVGGSRDISTEAHISLLDNKQNAERVELNQAPGRFQAPVWSADGKYLFYIAGNEAGVDAIYRSQIETGEEKRILDLLGFAHIVLAPDGQHLAYLQFEKGTRPPFGRAYLLDVESGEDKSLTDDLIASIYWSPDGRKLALLSINLGPEGPTAAKIEGLAAPLSQKGVLRWWVYDVEAEMLEPLISFDPTTQFLQTVPYFDQYHLSLTFWSPDSRYLVVTKQEAEEGHGSVWVVDTTGEEAHRKIGDGSLAVWSWR